MSEQVSNDWLDSLMILARATSPLDAREVVRDYRVIEDTINNAPHRMIETSPSGREIRELFIASPIIAQDGSRGTLESLPRIERVEILTYAAAGAWWLKHYPGDPFISQREAFQQLCRRLGCYWTNTPSIRERWRLIDYYAPAHTLPNAVFEDRPKCGICSQPVATGASGLDKAGMWHPDVHEECLRYAHRILTPPQVVTSDRPEAESSNQPRRRMAE